MIYSDLCESAKEEAARMQRAHDLGFTVRAYHGTGQKFNEFDLDKGKPNVLSGYAPHFASSKDEAKGYAKDRKVKGLKTNTLECLLRIKKPFEAEYGKDISAKEFKKITGIMPKDKYQSTSMDVLRVLSTIHGWDRDQYADKKMMWTLIYGRLKKLGYDSIIFLNTLPDYSDKHYSKIVMLDTKNIRLVTAQFDPAKSDSSDLLA